MQEEQKTQIAHKTHKTFIIKKIKEVPGLYYIDNVNIDLEKVLIKVDKCEWKSLSKSSNSRKVQHYGYKYNYRTRNIHEKCEDMPLFLTRIINKLIKICKIKKLINYDYTFNQCIINNYESKQGISRHIDIKEYGDVIGCYSAGGYGTMIFKKYDISHKITVSPGSLYIMTGDSRYKWTHEMPPCVYDIVDGKKIKRNRRVSLTFRNVPKK